VTRNQIILPINIATVAVNAFGELLRDLLFDQKNGEERGCYSTFDVREGWVAWPGATLMEAAYFQIAAEHQWDEEDWSIRQEDWRRATGFWKIFGTVPVHAAWFWDGDGALAFGIGDPYERVIINTDCKRDYGWGDAGGNHWTEDVDELGGF
jgi:hypothetical protein